MSKKVAILQSNYLPWKGVFDMMNKVDCFVFYEDVQYTSRDWRNRNKVHTKDGDKWITVPVCKPKSREEIISNIKINNDESWQEKHYNTFKWSYEKAPYYNENKWILDKIFKEHKWEYLTELNQYSTKLIAKVLGIEVEFVDSVDLNTNGTKDDKLIEICNKVGGSSYLSGPSAKEYIVKEKFEDAGIELLYMEYNYPIYKQLYDPFSHYVTVLDLMFNCGNSASKYIWG